MMRLHIKKTRKSLLGVFVVAGLLLTVGTLTVFASYGLTSDLPSNNENYQAAGNNGALDLHLKNLDVAQVTVNKFAAYYPPSITSSNNKSITITKGKSANRICHIDADVTTGNLRVRINVAGANATYNIPIEDVCDGNNFYGRTFDFPDGTLYPNPGSNHNRADIEVSLRNTVMKAASEGQDLNYQVSLSGGGASSGVLALKENLDPQQFGLRSTYTDNSPQPGNQNVRATLPFGYPCSTNVGDAQERFVKVYDADAVFGETFMWVERDGVKLNHSDYENSNNPDENTGGNYKVVNMNEAQFNSNGKRWTLEGSNESFNKLTVKREAILKGHKYELVILNTGNGASLSTHFNTLSVAIPQDGIYSELGLGNDPCNYSLRPTVSVDPDSFVYYPNLRVDASIQKTDTGPVNENHTWQLFSVQYPGEPATRNLNNGKISDSTLPCDVIPAGYVSGSCGFISTMTYPGQPSTTIDPYTSGGPYPVGTRLCFFARIQDPTYREDDNDEWHYSNLDCSMSAKKPRVQFLGSDLRVGGNVTSTYYNVQGNNYGSWVEYGAFVAGVNSLISSGNSLRSGNSNPDSTWNRLTFANTPSYGSYSPLPATSSAYAYFRGLPESGGNFNQGNPTTGVYEFDSSSNLGAMNVNANGRSIVIRKTGTLRISNNIIVDNNGVTSARNLSQVVIVADNIDIGQNVDRIDAWLITGATGRINTCDIGAQTLTSNVCNGQLNINGPVYANRLMLRRTAGSNPPGAAQLAEPAERFNLRPDAQLWAYTYANKADYAQTDFVQELPPRY